MEIINLLISIISGLIGGNVAGSALPKQSLGSVGNTVAGAVGGGLGGYILQALELFKQVSETAQGAAGAATSTGIDFGSILANIGSSGVGGAVLTILIGIIKNALSK